jgi:alpha-ribazole phosphatase
VGTLILVRHGHTELNRPGDDERLRAWLDIPLDETGLEEAVDTAIRVAQHDVERIYTSDLRRAIQTAGLISGLTGAPTVATNSLRPWNLGSLAGEKIRDILRHLDELKAYPKMRAPGGESYNEFYSRFAAGLRALARVASKSSKSIVLVTHVRNFLATPVILAGGNAGAVPVKGGPRTGSILLVEKNGHGWKIKPENHFGNGNGNGHGHNGKFLTLTRDSGRKGLPIDSDSAQ